MSPSAPSSRISSLLARLLWFLKIAPQDLRFSSSMHARSPSVRMVIIPALRSANPEAKFFGCFLAAGDRQGTFVRRNTYTIYLYVSMHCTLHTYTIQVQGMCLVGGMGRSRTGSSVVFIGSEKYSHHGHTHTHVHTRETQCASRLEHLAQNNDTPTSLLRRR